MQLLTNSSEINVGDIISEQGVISDMWNEDYDDGGTEYNEFCRFIVVEKINTADTPMIITAANDYYFHVQMIYMIPEIAGLYERMSAARSMVTDYEIDDEDDDGLKATDSPRKWYKCI
tara:strand:+ start:1193 stop:1546 length:354 start_codon:yes stop_codon:yes gene_type:complete